MKSLRNLWGFKIQASDGELGKVRDFLLDDQTWTIRYLVVELGSWVRSRDVLVPPEFFDRAVDNDRRFIVSLDKEALQNSLVIDDDKPVSLQQDIPWRLTYHVSAGFILTDKGRKRTDESGEKMRGNPHVRSIRELIGYCVYALDGEVGNVKDFLVNDSLYEIPYMCVTIPKPRRNRLRIVATDLIETVSWFETKVYIDATRTAVKNAPTLSPGRAIDRDFEMEISIHYNARRYSR
jgi:hypothetical protein